MWLIVHATSLGDNETSRTAVRSGSAKTFRHRVFGSLSFVSIEDLWQTSTTPSLLRQRAEC